MWAEPCIGIGRVCCARQLVCDKAVFLSNSFHREIWVVGWFGQCRGDHFSSVGKVLGAFVVLTVHCVIRQLV